MLAFIVFHVEMFKLRQSQKKEGVIFA